MDYANLSSNAFIEKWLFGAFIAGIFHHMQNYVCEM